LPSILTNSEFGFRFNHPNIFLTCQSPKMNLASYILNFRE
jgi:hypothetical protein